MQLTKNNEIEFYKYSITQSRDFWRSSCEALEIQFKNNFKLTNENICDASEPKYPKWFIGAQINIADSLLKNAKTDPDKIAIIYKDESGDEKRYTHKQLDELSNKFANSLRDKGINKGDYVGLCTGGMNPESIAAYIGTMKIGAVTVCLLPTTESQMKVRLDQVPEKIKLFVTQNYTDMSEDAPKDLYEKISAINSAPKVVIKNRDNTKSGDIEFGEFINKASSKFESETLSPQDNIAILFSSGTTGIPKAIPWTPDCYIKSANDARLHMLMNKNDVLCWPSNFGWMMGSFDISAAFINGAALACYEGNVVSKEFGQFVASSKVTKMGLVPRFGELWQEKRSMEGSDFSSIKIFMSTSAPSNPDNYKYIQKLFNNAHSCEYSGGTEIAGALNTTLPYADIEVSKFNTPAFGTKLYLKPEGDDPRYVKVYVVMANDNGYLPAMGLSKTLVNPSITHDEKYPLMDGKYRPHGDIFVFEKGHEFSGELTDIKDLNFRSGGRDNLLNINGNKMPFEEIEQWIMNSLKDSEYGKHVKDLVVFQTEPDHGNKVVYYVKLNEGANIENPSGIFSKVIKDAIKKQDKKFAVINDIRFDGDILRNGSKIQRNAMRDIYQKEIKH